jgi:hypothetical protein
MVMAVIVRVRGEFSVSAAIKADTDEDAVTAATRLMRMPSVDLVK